MELIDYNRYVWRSDPSVPGRHIREAGGGEVIEDVWKLTKHGEQNLFLGIYATLSAPLDTETLFAHIKRAWRSLRWEVPTIAATTSHTWHGEEGKVPTTFIVYDEAKSEEDVQTWLEETVRLFPAYGAAGKSLDDLRYDIGQDPIPATDFDRQTFLYVVPYSPSKFGLLLHTSHVPVDGSGVKILMTKLLTHLVAHIADPASRARHEDARIVWGREAGWLLPIVTEILREEEPEVRDASGRVVSEAKKAEPRDGPEYWATLGDVMKGLIEGMPRAHHFKSFIEPRFDPTTCTPKTRRFEHKFTPAQSSSIHRAGSVGVNGNTAKLTVNHLVHGALSLLPLFDNPPPRDTDALVFYYGLVDGRQRLRKDFRDPLGYPGYCLGMSALHISAALFHHFPRGEGEGEGGEKKNRRALVLAYAREVKREYEKQAAYPALVAIEPQQGDLMLNAPPPPPWSGPAYAADGKGAVYLRPTYAAGDTTIEIDDFFIGLNKCDPGPFFRCTEWKGRIILSVDWNEFAVSEETIKQWMGLWVDLLLSLID